LATGIGPKLMKASIGASQIRQWSVMGR
jgi:hypothetical protein